MEEISKVAARAMNQLQKLSQRNLDPIQITGEISLYSGELTAGGVVLAIKNITKAFPSLPTSFFDVFTDRISENGFSDDRLRDAVNHVIDTCIYPTPTIAQFISFDKRVKVFKYSDIVKMVEGEDPKAFDKYQRIEINGLPEAVWIHINDIAKYKIKTNETKG